MEGQSLHCAEKLGLSRETCPRRSGVPPGKDRRVIRGEACGLAPSELLDRAGRQAIPPNGPGLCRLPLRESWAAAEEGGSANVQFQRVVRTRIAVQAPFARWLVNVDLLCETDKDAVAVKLPARAQIPSRPSESNRRDRHGNDWRDGHRSVFLSVSAAMPALRPL